MGRGAYRSSVTSMVYVVMFIMLAASEVAEAEVSLRSVSDFAAAVSTTILVSKNLGIFIRTLSTITAIGHGNNSELITFEEA